MANREPFGVGEWYHCYTRGVDKRRTFMNAADYQRFIQLLYIANTSEAIDRKILRESHRKVLSKDRGKSLVSIGAYALMPNHFHLLIQEVNDGGIAKFMQKLGISYAMYFNKKNDRTGNLFVKPFRSKRIEDDVYLKRVAQYIHLNPIELFEPAWKEGRVKSISTIEGKLRAYPYSSLKSYEDSAQLEKVILSDDAMLTISEDMPKLREIVNEAYEYFKKTVFKPKQRS
jgi:putative transposase